MSQDRRAYQLEWLSKRHVESLFGPAADLLSAAHAGRKNLGVGARVLYGRVLDSVAYAHCYRVAFEKGHPPMICAAPGSAGASPVGARTVTCLAPGSKVWVVVHPGMAWGLILGVEPSYMTDPTLGMSDFFHQSSRCGLRVDGTHNGVFRLNNGGGVVDFSSGRPFDGTAANEWGAVTETGLKVTLDSYMAQLSADEATGVFAFYHDQLLRVCGVNWQAFSGAHEEDFWADVREVGGYRGHAVYPWEQLGAFGPGDALVRRVDPRASQVDTPHYAAAEPADDRQKPFHRVVGLSGYVGQGGKRVVLVPPAAGLSKYGEAADLVAVFEEQTTLSGKYSVRAAKGVYLEKRVSIPAPQRLDRPENPAGDDASSYRFSGLEGSGPPHLVAGGVAASDPAAGFQHAAAYADSEAYANNWEGEHALHYHAKDWALPEESAGRLPRNEQPVDFASLADKGALDPPRPVEFAVDARYGDVKYFPNRSYIALLDDGGVVIGDGYGAEIRMVGGKIQLSAPGDVDILPGRNANVLAGRDAVIRAKHAFDVSCSDGDGRIKADRNLHLLGGNSGAGGVLIESKGAESYDYAGKQGEDVVSGGVQIKSAAAPFTVWAAGVYLRTGGGDVGPGAVTVDAGAGSSDVVVNAMNVSRYVGGTATDTFGAAGAAAGVNTWSGGGHAVCGGLSLGGRLAVGGGIGCTGWVEVAAGHVATELAADYADKFDELSGPRLAAAQDAAASAGADADASRRAADAAFRAAFAAGLYADGGAGADATIEAAHFSFRSSLQYRAGDFELWEARWQQLARLTGGAPAAWAESPVRSGTVVSMPYPGKERWADAASLVEQDLALYDAAAGVSKPRAGGAYDAPRFAAPSRKPCDGNYAVII